MVGKRRTRFNPSSGHGGTSKSRGIAKSGGKASPAQDRSRIVTVRNPAGRASAGTSGGKGGGSFGGSDVFPRRRTRQDVFRRAGMSM